MFFFECIGHLRDLHSFPTRRSSDLRPVRASARRGDGGVPALGIRAKEEGDRRGDPGGDDLLHRRNSGVGGDRKSTRLNSSHLGTSYAVFCLNKKAGRLRRNIPCPGG